MLDKLRAVENRYEELCAKSEQPDFYSDPKKAANLLREKDVSDIKTVQFAILETSGRVSVFPYPKDRPATAQEAGIQAQKQYLPVTIISDGALLQQNLGISGKYMDLIQRVLKERKTTLQNTFLLTVDEADHICWYPKEDL